MMGLMIEAVVMAFVIGGIVGAITTLKLNNNANNVLVKIQRDQSQHRRRFR